MMKLSTRRPLASLFSLLFLLHVAAPVEAQFGLKPAAGPKPLAVFTLPDWGTSVAFSSDGRRAAIGTYGKALIVDVETRTVAREIAVKSGYVRGLAWLNDHATLVTGCFQAVEFWNVADGANLRSLKVKGYTNDLKVSPDGQILAAAMETGDVRLWNTADGSERPALSGVREPLLAVAFSADGKLLAAAGGDETRLSRPGVARVWNVSDGTEARALDVVPEKCATDISFSPDGGTLYVADMNDRVTLFDLSTGIARGYFGKHGRPVNSVVPMKDGARVISGAGGRFQDGNLVKVWTAADGKELATLEHHTGKVARIALSPDESTVLTVSMDKTAALWSVADVLKADAQSPAPVEPRSETARGRNPWKLSLGPQFAADLKFPEEEGAFKKVGIIGLDTSHSVAFSKEFNSVILPNPKDPTAPKTPTFAPQAKELQGFRVTAAYPKGSNDIEGSVSRVPGYTKDVLAQNVKIVDSIEELLKDVDYVLLESNDGRPHLEQVLPVLKARKPVFVDKPIAGSLADAIAIYELARHYQTPLFSSSSLRYTAGAQLTRAGRFGGIMGADAFSPCSLEPTHPDLYWYGIHGVEILFTAMGTGCQTVSRTSTEEFDLAVGTWTGGRVGTFRGIRGAKTAYGLSIFSKTTSRSVDLNNPEGKPVDPKVRPKSLYFPLLAEIARFFKTGTPPVTEAETLEIYAFMSAADESKKQGGKPVAIADVMTKARAEAAEIVKAKLK